MRIVLFGASGQSGREVAKLALERKHQVTAFVRDPAKLGSVASALRVVRADVVDSSEVHRAIADQDAVVSCLGVGTPLKPDPAVVSGVQNIIAAMRSHGIQRLIYQSFIGVAASRDAVGFILRYIAPLPLRHEIADHELKEALVSASDLDWTIIRPPKLTNGRRSAYRVGEDITTWVPVPTLPRASVAHFIVHELEQPAFIRKTARLLH